MHEFKSFYLFIMFLTPRWADLPNRLLPNWQGIRGTYRFKVLIQEDAPFLLKYFKTMSEGPTKAWTLASQPRTLERWPQRHTCWSASLCYLETFLLELLSSFQSVINICYLPRLGGPYWKILRPRHNIFPEWNDLNGKFFSIFLLDALLKFLKF